MNKHRINMYVCPDNHQLVVRDLDQGTTPVAIRCTQCDKTAVSMGYAIDQQRVPTHEFYKPAHPERYGKGSQMYAHIQAGGLAFRHIGEPDQTELMPEVVEKAVKSKEKASRFSYLAQQALKNVKK